MNNNNQSLSTRNGRYATRACRNLKRMLFISIYHFALLFYIVISPGIRLKEFLAKAFRQALWKKRLGALGDNVKIFPHVVIHNPKNVFVGNNVSIAEFVHIWGGGGVWIGDDTIVAAHAVITSLTHDKNAPMYRKTLVRKSVKIGKGVWIGSGGIILPGVTVKDGAIIGAGSVVTKDVESGVIVAGVSAQPIAGGNSG